MIAMFFSIGLFACIGVALNLNTAYWVLLALYFIARASGLWLNAGHHISLDKDISAVLKNTDNILKVDEKIIKNSGDIINLNDHLLAELKKSSKENEIHE